MMFIVSLLVLAGLVGCQDSEQESSVHGLVVEAPVVSAPIQEPWVNEKFMGDGKVEAWRAKLNAAILKDAVVVEPRDAWVYARDFVVDRSGRDPAIGDPDIWSSKWTPMHEEYVDDRVPTLDEARHLEATNKKWPAAQIYVVLEDFDSANRCAANLFKEGSYKVAAMTAVLTGDYEMLDQATNKLVNELDQVTDAQDVIRFAVDVDEYQAAVAIANHHGWNLNQILRGHEFRRVVYANGDTMLPDLIEKELGLWESLDVRAIEDQDDPVIVVADIVRLSQTDPVKAKKYAARYLSIPHANLFVWELDGDIPEMIPVRGSLEFYQLVKDDPELRKLYQDRIEQFFARASPVVTEDGRLLKSVILGTPSYFRSTDFEFRDWNNETSNLLYTHLWLVRQSGDAELKALWTKMLDGFPKTATDEGYYLDSFVFEREFGRYVLGLKFDANNENLNGSEKIALATLQGQSVPDMSGVWALWQNSPPTIEEIGQMETLFNFLTRGGDASKQESFEWSMNAHYGTSHVIEDVMISAKKVARHNKEAQDTRIKRGLPPIDLYPDTNEELDELLAPSLELMAKHLPVRHMNFVLK